MNGLDRPGFADPVAAAQACFRAVLDAMSRPGRLRACGGDLRPPAPLGAAASAVLLTLVDAETSLWLDPPASAAADWIAFHCGAKLTSRPSEAAFALAVALPGLDLFAPGTHEAPETATTVIVEVAALGAGRRYRLSGPGLRAPSLLEVDGLPSDFAHDWQARRAGFPLGVDLILCAGASLCALPRGVAVEDC